MSAALALNSARAIGIRVRVDGDDLELEAAAPPPAAVLDLLLRHKADILRLLRQTDDGCSPEDWQVFFGERAAIAEYDGGLPRDKAERCAFACCVTEWLNRNPTPSMPGQCLGCGGGEHLDDPLLPFGTDTTGSCLGPSHLLAGLASGTRGGSDCGACIDGSCEERMHRKRPAGECKCCVGEERGVRRTTRYFRGDPVEDLRWEVFKSWLWSEWLQPERDTPHAVLTLRRIAEFEEYAEDDIAALKELKALLKTRTDPDAKTALKYIARFEETEEPWEMLAKFRFWLQEQASGTSGSKPDTPTSRLNVA